MSSRGPTQRARVIDHVVGLTADLDATSALFEQLGFRLTPKASHSEALGTENRCIMLEQGYIELLGVRRHTSFNAPLRERLARGDGWAGIAFATSDMDETRRLLEGCCEIGSALSFDRTLPDCDKSASFTILPIRSIGLTGLETFFCQHHSLDRLRRGADLRNPNGARALGACRLAATDIAAARAFCDRVGGNGELELVAAQSDQGAVMAHVEVIVANLADIRARARRAGLVDLEVPDGVDLPAQQSLALPMRLIGETS